MRKLITLSEYLDARSIKSWDFPYTGYYIEDFNISCVTVHHGISDIPIRYILIGDRLVYELESIHFGKILCLDEKCFHFGYNIKFEEYCLQKQFSDTPYLFAWNIRAKDDETAVDVFLNDTFDKYVSESEYNKKCVGVQTFFKDKFFLRKEHREMYKKHISENKSNK